MEIIQILTNKCLRRRATSFGFAALFLVLTSGCIPNDNKGIEMKDEASREQLIQALEVAKIRHRVDKNGVIWYRPEDEDAVTDAIAHMNIDE